MHGTSIAERLTARFGGNKISSFVAVLICLVVSHATSAQSLTPEQKVGQLMIWSFGGTELTPELKAHLTKYQPGALIVFRRNIKTATQVARLNADLRKFAATKLKAPLLSMIDQEGGLVTRIRTNTPSPSALALAKMDEPFIENYARANAEMLGLLGFNVNLAPVLDISNPLKDSFIGNRAFGDDPAEVARVTLAYARGLSAAGMIPTAKHFPGHGGTLQNSHQTLPKKLSTLEELQNKDFVPFTTFTAAEFPKAVMMAHLALPAVDPSGLPATYSKPLIDLLRTGLGYDGLIMTDDLEMNGASVARDIGERAVRAFLAGNDMLMFAGPPANQRRAFEAMVAAVKSGRIPAEQLDASLARIANLKNALPKAETSDEKKIVASFRKVDTLSREVLKHGFDVAAAAAKREWSDVDADTRVTVFSGSALFTNKFKTAFKGKTKSFAMGPRSLENVRHELSSGRADLNVYFASGDGSAHWLNGLTADQRAKLIVVNCNHPGEIDAQDEFMAVFNVNSYFTDVGTYLGKLLSEPAADTRGPAGHDDEDDGSP